MKLDRRNFMAGSFGLAAAGATTALYLGPEDKRGPRREVAKADIPPSRDEKDLLPSDLDLDRLQWTSLLYYLHETNPDNGLVRDKTDPASPSSIAAIGMALATLPVSHRARRALPAVRGQVGPPEAPVPATSSPRGRNRTPRGTKASSTTSSTSRPAAGRGSASCPRSTRRSCLPGCSTAATYFDNETADEAEVRRLAAELYRRADWDWARNGGPRSRTAGGRRPASFRTATRVLTKACSCTCSAWARRPTRSPRRATLPFVRLTSGNGSTAASWSTPDRYSPTSCRICGSTFAASATPSCATAARDYFENSRQAAFVQQAYAVHNPMQFVGYGEQCWGFTACDGPGWVKRVVDGVERQFFDYIARGAPFGPG